MKTVIPVQIDDREVSIEDYGYPKSGVLLKIKNQGTGKDEIAWLNNAGKRVLRDLLTEQLGDAEEDFYEEDEPAEEILDAFNEAPKFITGYAATLAPNIYERVQAYDAVTRRLDIHVGAVLADAGMAVTFDSAAEYRMLLGETDEPTPTEPVTGPVEETITGQTYEVQAWQSYGDQSTVYVSVESLDGNNEGASCGGAEITPADARLFAHALLKAADDAEAAQD